jgi:maltose alpha-D-glucosyltransferase/alpha-amylase
VNDLEFSFYFGDWRNVPANRLQSDTVAGLRQKLAAQLPAFLSSKRWFGGKARHIDAVDVVEAIPFGKSKTIIAIVIVRYSDGAEETYSIPLSLSGSSVGSSATDLAAGLPVASDGAAALQDAFANQAFLSELLDIISREGEVASEKGTLLGRRTSVFSDMVPDSAPPPKLLTGEQSNSSVIYGERLILKFFRRMEAGENPDLEIGRFLTEKARFTHVARIAGSLEYKPQQGQAATQAILQEFVENRGDAWRYAVKVLTEFYRRTSDSASQQIVPEANHSSNFADEAMRHLLEEIALLGRRTAELHLALSSDFHDPAFAPEPFSMKFQESLQASFHDLTARTFRLLGARLQDIPAENRAKSVAVAARESEILRMFAAALGARVDAMRVRIHGDYHLGQVLYTGSDFVIIDFEGEPARPLAERRVKQSPLQDVAGMLRSFHYAAFAPLLMSGGSETFPLARIGLLRSSAEAWSRRAADSFLNEYYATAGGASFLPASAPERARLLEGYLLAKAVYELGYELNNRPAWLGIPLEGISRLLPSRDQASG